MPARRHRRRNYAREITVAELAQSTPEVDLHGCTYEEADLILEQFLADEIKDHTPVVRIIHGHGSGVLRSCAHRVLSCHPKVKDIAAATRGGQIGAVTYAALDID